MRRALFDDERFNLWQDVPFPQCLRYRLLRIKSIKMSLLLLKLRLPAECFPLS